MFDQIGKLKELKSKMDEVKARLEAITVIGEAGNGDVRVMCNGNRRIKNIHVNNTLFKTGDSEQIEELIVTATNRSLEQADRVNEAEMQAAAMGMMGSFPGLK